MVSGVIYTIIRVSWSDKNNGAINRYRRAVIEWAVAQRKKISIGEKL